MNKIPGDVIIQQFSSLACLDLISLSLTCKRFSLICKDERLWKNKFLLNFGNVGWDPSHFENAESLESYHNIYQLIHKGELLICDFQVRIQDKPKEKMFNNDFEAQVHEYYAQNGDEQDEQDKDKDKDETYRLLLTREHLDGLVVTAALSSKYEYYDDKNVTYRLKHVRSEDIKDKEERKWKRNTELARKEHEQEYELYTKYLNEYNLNGVTQKLDDIARNNHIPIYNCESHPLPARKFGATQFKCVSKPERQDEFGNMATVESLWRNIFSSEKVPSISTRPKDPLPVFTEPESILHYCERLVGYRFRPKEFVIVLSSPDKEVWTVMTFDNKNILNGIKLGSKILKISLKDFCSLVFRLKGEILTFQD